MTILSKTTKLRLRRSFRQRQHQVENATQFAEYEFEKKVIGRLEKLRNVRRFVAAWLLLVTTLIALVSLQTVGLSQYYQKTGAVAGGVYTEGMIGTFSNANPLYAIGAVDTSVSRLLFSGLFRYNDKNMLVGDLAKDYQVDESGKQYTVHLRPKLTWHDGKKLTSRDVAFTFKTIQNPDAQSPLFSSWQGIQITTPNDQTVVFQLPNALTAFPHSLVTGIIPQHVLGTIPANTLRAHNFNTTTPVGAGPFTWGALQLGDTTTPDDATAIISLKAFHSYNKGKPKLDGFTIHTYENPENLLKAYRKRSVEAAAGLQEIPKSFKQDTRNYTYQFPTTAAVMVFFKMSGGLLADGAVRKALVLASDRNALLAELPFSVKPVRSPLLMGQLGYDDTLLQPGFNLAEAQKVLQDAGWVPGKDSVRVKNGQRLQFQILAEDTADNRTIISGLQRQWRALGAVMQPSWQQNSADMQGAVETHSYTALLYGISIGSDPDVYVYWDSTQADPRSVSRLNFSEYKSTVADTALEAARTRSDPAVRTLKYQAFLKAWQEDYPALALYQPVSLYVTRGGSIHGLAEHVINNDADRYYSVTDWAVKSGRVPK